MTAVTARRRSGTERLDNARFCHGCGSLDNGDALAEYKQVTVLFADVVDSMDIASAVGAERLLAVWLNETSAASARKSIAGGGTSVR
jgi:adenylate cyclase